MNIRKIAVTTDFSEAARHAYPTAVHWAEKFGANLHLVHAAEPLLGVHAPLTRREYMNSLALSMEDEAKNSHFNGLQPQTHVLQELPARQALAVFLEKWQFDLVVVASHGHSALGATLLGSFAQAVVRSSTVPVLTCRSGSVDAPVTPNEVLVPFDFSQTAKAVFPMVRTLWDTFRPRIVFFHAVDLAEAATLAWSKAEKHGAQPYLMEGYAEAPVRAQMRFVEVREREFPGIETHMEVTRGRPHVEIVHKAEQPAADLIVMATHGLTGFTRFITGSVAERVVRAAPCSVLTVHPSSVPAAEVEPTGKEAEEVTRSGQ